MWVNLLTNKPKYPADTHPGLINILSAPKATKAGKPGAVSVLAMPGEGASFNLYQLLIPGKEVAFQTALNKKHGLN